MKDIAMKDVSVLLGIIVVLGGGFLSYGKLQAQQVSIKEVVDENKDEIKQTEDRLVENEKVDIEQSILLKQVADILGDVQEELRK